MNGGPTVGFHDRAAATAANIGADGPPGPLLQRFIEAPPADPDALDLGCGHAVASPHLPRAGRRVTEGGAVFMGLTFVVFLGCGFFAAAARDLVLESLRAMSCARRVFAATFAGLGLKLVLERA